MREDFKITVAIAVTGIGVVAGMFFLIGMLVHRGDTDVSPLIFLKVTVNFVVMLCGSALTVGATGLVIVALIAGTAAVVPKLDEETIYAVITGPVVLLVIFLLITSAAILQFLLREQLHRWHMLFRFSDDDYALSEYLIQWSTIFLAVYQVVFQGLSEAASELLHVESSQQVLAAVLNPNNMNLTVQPLLMCSWISLVMEKLRHRHRLGVHQQWAAPQVLSDDR
ncbi:hypothetical protein ACFPVT_08580 [Corynebacterium choanae]|uniref:Uncharacterized protein n=1 Tax=Corynebacterium choanae TaxID=1862358 RepID=A0A3G6J6B8_9CORY|nr:hypothetical protein [Corynebacterium choanae]AZA13313.1 hypothetical protein CCHOA_04525 [Corynebacterium choanae]